MNKLCNNTLHTTTPSPTSPSQPLLALGLLLFGLCVGAHAANTSDYTAPRTQYGHPDISGVWNFSSDTPLERPTQYGNKEFLTPEELAEIRAKDLARREAADNTTRDGRVGGYNQFWVESLAMDENYRTSLVVDPPNGRLPPLVKGAIVHRGGLGPDSAGERPVRFRVGGIGKDGPEDRGLSERCLMGFNSGPPFMPSMYNNNVQIFQNKDHVVILTEMIHDARIVPLDSTPLDNRPFLPENMTQWSGVSRGAWEGDTLVVVTKNFTDKIQTFRSAGIGSNMTLTERFTRVADNRVEYRFTIDDPTTYTKPFTVLVPMAKVDGEVFEYACHEGNYGMVNILGGARKEERDAAAKK